MGIERKTVNGVLANELPLWVPGAQPLWGLRGKCKICFTIALVEGEEAGTFIHTAPFSQLFNVPEGDCELPGTSLCSLCKPRGPTAQRK